MNRLGHRKRAGIVSLCIGVVAILAVPATASTAALPARDQVRSPELATTGVRLPEATSFPKQAGLIAKNGGAGDEFGDDVAISGGTLVAIGDANWKGTSFMAAAYVFTNTSGT
jgi:FG-GAP repeat